MDHTPGPELKNMDSKPGSLVNGKQGGGQAAVFSLQACVLREGLRRTPDRLSGRARKFSRGQIDFHCNVGGWPSADSLSCTLPGE